MARITLKIQNGKRLFEGSGGEYVLGDQGRPFTASASTGLWEIGLFWTWEEMLGGRGHCSW